ncbi:MAG: metallophosphoesterase [Bacteroidales bacterium]|nr:metallophosphoesterase [Bacteroidales bacterium]
MFFLIALLCFTIPKMVIVAFSLVSRLLEKRNGKVSLFVNRLGVAVACIASVMAFYGIVFGWKQLETEYVDLYFEDLPESFDGYRIVHLSDLHLGTHGSKTAFVEKVVCRVNEEHPDLIVFTGDIVNSYPEELTPFVPVLSKLLAPDGVFSVFGNHDYCYYSRKGARAASLELAEKERSMGWQVLLNESKVLSRGEDRIAVAGLEYWGKYLILQDYNIKATLNGITDYDSIKCDDDIFTIMLCHTPSQWDLEILPNTHIPLTLSGHTHASQLKIGRWSPSSFLYKEWGGLYQSGNQQLYVSEGLGGTLPFRFGSRPQVIVLTLHSK